MKHKRCFYFAFLGALLSGTSAGWGITRQAMIDTAQVYAELEWTCYNTFTSSTHGAFIAGRQYTGEAYRFGGNDHWAAFLYKVEVLKLRPRQEAGIDCSAFVSKCWNFPFRPTTHTLPDVSAPIPRSKLRTGDILNKIGSHTVLIEHAPPAGPVVVYEAVGGTIARVVRRSVSWARFNGYSAWTLVDLAIRSEDVSFDPPTASSGEIVRIRATVHNRGGKMVPCEVSFYLEDASLKIASKSLEVPLNKSAEVELLWDTSGLPAGTYTIRGEVGRSVPTESDSSNNQVVLEYVLSGPTDVEEQISSPRRFGLSQNVPNPFNTDTMIEYSLAEAGHVVMALYDPMGRRIRTLVDEYKEAGRWTVRWDGKDGAGRNAASGLYLYRLEGSAGMESGCTHTKKMILLR